MKLVRFNVSTEYHNIPDDKYHKECEIMEKLEEDDWEKFAKKLSSTRNKYPYVTVKIGTESPVPNWYYEAHKDDAIEVSVSFDKYTDRFGNRIPFNMEEALKHGDVRSLEHNTKYVKRFELIEDLDNKKSKAS